MDTEDIMFHIIVFQKIHEKNTLHHILYSNKFIPRQNAEMHFRALFFYHTQRRISSKGHRTQEAV